MQTADKHLTHRAKAARTAIRAGADPILQLSYVVWPTPAIERAERQTAWHPNLESRGLAQT